LRLNPGSLNAISSTSAPWSAAQMTPAITALSRPSPPLFSTVTGMICTPVNATPAIPSIGTASVRAATMPASQVPWPLGSTMPFEPSIIEMPGTTTPARSGCCASTPVSRIATFAVPGTSTAPNTLSHPIFGSAHWLV
jgi:hypothetical protein